MEWALVGFYAGLMPAILSHDLHINNHAAAGALLFELATVVAVAIIATQALASRTSMMWSLAIMIPAAAAVVAAHLPPASADNAGGDRCRRCVHRPRISGSSQIVNQPPRISAPIAKPWDESFAGGAVAAPKVAR
jgi:hypothetical protein